MELENAFMNFVHSSKLKLVCFEFCFKICYTVVVYTFLILSYRILKSMCIKGSVLWLSSTNISHECMAAEFGDWCCSIMKLALASQTL